MSVQSMIRRAQRDLGLGEPNYLQRRYESRNGNLGGNWAWCDAAITIWALESGNYDAVCMGTDYAYTVWHAQDFQRAGSWYSGTAANLDGARPGDIVFFDWGGTNSVGRIDHVGVVERRLGGGRVQTIEGNTSDRCARRVRSSSVIAGFGRPAYSGSSGGGGGGLLRQGDSGPAVREWQHDLITWDPNALPVHGADGDFGEETEDWTHRFQRLTGITSDGIVGPQTRAAMEEELDMPSRQEIRDAVLHDQEIAFNKGTKRESPKSLAGYLQHLENEQDTTQNLIRAQNTTINKLVDMLNAFSGGTDFDPETLKREIREAIESVTVRLDVGEES